MLVLSIPLLGEVSRGGFMVPMRDETPCGLFMNLRFLLVVVLVLVID